MADSWTVLGSGTLEFLAGRNPSSHLLRVGGSSILVDSGPGALSALAQRGLDSRALAAVVHSHLHLDHLGDLFPLWFHFRLTARPDDRLLLVGAPGHEVTLAAAAAALDPKLLLAPVEFVEHAPDGTPRPVPGTCVTVAAFPANHSRSPRVLRFEGPGWSLAYSGDTGPCQGLVDAARGVDWLVVECSTPDEAPRSRHLTPSQIAPVLLDARPKAVALVHLSPLWETPEDAAAAVRRAAQGYGGEVVGARDGLELPLPYSHSMVPGGLLEMS